MTDTTQIAKAGDTVQIHYTGTLDDGSTFDSSEGRDPLQFALGSGQVIKGFDEGVTGMAQGEKKTIHIKCEDAYGPIRPDLIHKVAREQIPAEIPLSEGLMLQMQDTGGTVLPVKVVSFDDEAVTMDANHALAGKDLTFELELVSIGEAASEGECGCC